MYTTKQAYRTEHNMDDRTEVVLVEALRTYARKSEELLAKAEQVRHAADRTERLVEADLHVNSLGELQSTAREFERLCTEREVAGDAVRQLSWAVGDRAEVLLKGTPFEKGN